MSTGAKKELKIARSLRARGASVKVSDEDKLDLIEKAALELYEKFGAEELEIISKEYITLGEKAAVGEYIFKFTDLRRWVEFQVVEDPGYLIACASLWLGLVALLMRYIPDLQKWSISSEQS